MNNKNKKILNYFLLAQKKEAQRPLFKLIIVLITESLELRLQLRMFRLRMHLASS